MQEVRSTVVAYEAPKLKRYGNFARLTLAASTGAQLDAPYPTGTPFSQLTFST